MSSEERSRAELESELEQVRAELEGFREREEVAAGRRRWALGFGGRFLVGKELRKSFRAWLEAKSLGDPLPADETARVLAAIVRRVVRVGFVGAALAAIPTALTGGFLVHQSTLMKEQNDALQIQNDTLGSQIDQQAADTLVVRRAQLLATIYEEDCEEVLIKAEPADELEEGAEGDSSAEKTPSDMKEVCQQRAHPRAREEAVIAFCEIERSRGAEPNLRIVVLAGLYLHAANLSGVSFSFADLNGAHLARANVSDVNLMGADLSATNFSDADLSGARLDFATFSDAILNNADLSGASLTYVKNLTQEQINYAFGDANTELPGGFNRPAHWGTEKVPAGDTTSDASSEHPPQSQSPEPSNP